VENKVPFDCLLT